MVVLAREKDICYSDIAKLRAEYAFLKNLLLVAWSEDSDMDKVCTERDLLILNQLAEVLNVSYKRTGVVTHVEEGLNVELDQLSSFLDSVAERRPKGNISSCTRTRYQQQRVNTTCVLVNRQHPSTVRRIY